METDTVFFSPSLFFSRPSPPDRAITSSFDISSYSYVISYLSIAESNVPQEILRNFAASLLFQSLTKRAINMAFVSARATSA